MPYTLTPETLAANIQEMTERLLIVAGNLAYNPLSTNCQYIFSEIRNEQATLTERDRYAALQRTRPVPQPLAAIMPVVLRHYADLYDINLFIHEARRRLTIIDIRYYAKSSLEATYRQSMAAQAPMLHSKVSQPYWTVASPQKFDINWKTYAPISRAKRLWLSQKWRLLTHLHRRPS